MKASRLPWAAQQGQETCAEPGDCARPVEVEVRCYEGKKVLDGVDIGFCSVHGEMREPRQSERRKRGRWRR